MIGHVCCRPQPEAANEMSDHRYVIQSISKFNGAVYFLQPVRYGRPPVVFRWVEGRCSVFSNHQHRMVNAGAQTPPRLGGLDSNTELLRSERGAHLFHPLFHLVLLVLTVSPFLFSFSLFVRLHQFSEFIQTCSGVEVRCCN